MSKNILKVSEKYLNVFLHNFSLKTFVLSFSRFFLIVGLSFVFSCKKDQKAIEAFNDKEMQIETARDVEIVYSDSGMVKMQIKAPLMKRYRSKNPYTEMTEGVTAFTYNSDGQQASKMTADYAIRRERKKEIVAEGNVVLINIKGDTLYTPKIIWLEEKDSIYTNQTVKIRTLKNIINGKGLVSNANFSKYEIKGVTGVVSINEEQ